MTLFFSILSIVTYVSSHLWARINRPIDPDNFEWRLESNLPLEEVLKTIKNHAKNSRQLQLMIINSQNFIISESASFFDYGRFYHFQCETSQQGSVIKVHVQPKLVSTSNLKEKQLNQWTSQILLEFKNVG